MGKRNRIKNLALMLTIFVLLFVFYEIKTPVDTNRVSDGDTISNLATVNPMSIGPYIYKTESELADEIQCKEGSTDAQCLDKCSTSYTIKEPNAQFKTKSCFWSSQSDPIRKAAYAVIKNCKVYALEQVWRDAGCSNNPAKLTKSGQVKKSGQSNASGLAYEARDGKTQECNNAKKALVKAISESLSKAKTMTITGQNNYDICSYQGAVTCMQTTTSTKKFKCEPKKSSSGGSGGDTRTTSGGPPPYDSPFGGGGGVGDMGSGSGNSQGLMDKMKDLLGGQGSGGSGGGSGGGSYPSNNCASYYYRIFNRQECAPKNAVCSLNLSRVMVERGEPVTVRWDVKYSTEQSLNFDVSLGVDQEYTEKSGVVTIYPENSGSVVLDAVGRGDGNTCSKRVNITVLNPKGEGRFPPVVSCSPQFIRSGNPTEVNVSWQCRGDSAKYTTSENFGTGGNVAGSSAKTVQDTTEFKVNCYDENDNWLGSNSCTVKAENPLFEIIAYPEVVGRDEKVRISWGSIGMTTCRVDGPNGFSYEAQNAVVLTIPFTAENNTDEEIFTIQCASKYGGVYSRDVVVRQK